MKAFVVVVTLIAVALLVYALREAQRAQRADANRRLVMRYSVDPTMSLPDGVRSGSTGGRTWTAAFDSSAIEERIEGFLDLAGIKLQPDRAILTYVGVDVVLTVLFATFTGSYGLAFFWATLVLVLGTLQVIRSTRKHRRSTFERALPEFLMMLASSLRAGLSIQRGIEAVSSEGGGEVERQLRRASTEIAMGMRPDEALQEVAERMKSQDMQWVVVAIGIQRRVGGNLASVLDLVAETIRGRETIRQEVRAVSSEGRMSANVLVALPIGVFLMLFFTRREYVQVLWATTNGRALLFTTVALISAGMLWVRAMVSME